MRNQEFRLYIQSGECVAQKLKTTFAVLVYGHVYIIIMVILISLNKIPDFL